MNPSYKATPVDTILKAVDVHVAEDGRTERRLETATIKSETTIIPGVSATYPALATCPQSGSQELGRTL